MGRLDRRDASAVIRGSTTRSIGAPLHVEAVHDRHMRWPGVVALLAACGSDPAEVDRVVVAQGPATYHRELDLLVVVDDSGSTLDLQQNFAVSFPNFSNQLANLPGGLPDLHLGVTTTDMGTLGSSSPNPAADIGTAGSVGGCMGSGKAGNLTTHGAPVTGVFLTDVQQSDGTRAKNYTGELADVAGQMIRADASGCGFEQPLAAMRAALADNPANIGFLRSDALLAVIFLVDEDDCSAKDAAELFGPDSLERGPLASFRCTRFGVTCDDGGATPDEMNQAGVKRRCHANEASALLDGVASYRDFLLALKSDPSDVVVGGVFGDPEPVAVEQRTVAGIAQPALAHSCSYDPDNNPATNNNQVADPAVRLQSFVDSFPNQSQAATVCMQDLSATLARLGQLAGRGLGSGCLFEQPLDTELATAGLQPDCVVEDLVGDVALVVPPCDGDPSSPCWELVPNAERCPTAPQLALGVLRDSEPAAATVTRMRCRVE